MRRRTENEVGLDEHDDNEDDYDHKCRHRGSYMSAHVLLIL